MTTSTPSPRPSGGAVGSLTAMRLVAGREVSTRMRSKAFRIMTAIVLAAIVLMVLIFHFVSGREPSATKIGVVGVSAQQLTGWEATGDAVGEKIAAEPVASADAGRTLVANGDIEALVVPTDGGDMTVVVESSLSSELRTVLTAVSRNHVLDHQILSLGGDPAEVGAAVAAAQIDVKPIEPPHQYSVADLVLGMSAGILIYLSLMTCGQWVAQGVVEEKSSRVVELLLATVRPWELMTGKVMGIGLVGLIQIVLFGVVGMALSGGLGVMTLSFGAAASTILWLVVWYLIGYVMYAFAFAGAGALVSRQEDAAGVVMPVLMFVIVGYVVGISVLPSDPSNSLAEVLSIIPLFAPTLMPIRLAMGGVPVWEAVLSVVLSLALIPGLAWLSGRIFRNAVIRVGARVSLRTAFSRA